MKSDFLGLRTAIYKVGDIGKAKAWYSKVLGVQPYFDHPFYVGFNVGGYELGLYPATDPNEAKPESVKTYWGVDDVNNSYKKLLEQGASPNEEPQDVGEGIIVASVKDPWGNLFGIIYNPHFKLPTEG